MTISTKPLIDDFKDAYAKYAGLPDYSYTCIKLLMEENEPVWKLLKYNTPDALDMPDLTHAEKAALVYNSQPDSTSFKVFMDSANADSFTTECSMLRIYPYKIIPANRTIGIVIMAFEAFAHFKINQLSNYQTRVMRIVSEVIGTFNGSLIAGIGRLHFNGVQSYENRGVILGQIPFKGMAIYMSNKET